MNPFTKNVPAQNAEILRTKLESIKEKGGTGLLTTGNQTYHVKRLNLSEPGFAVFETVSGLYVKISGDYTFTTISKNA